MTPKATTPYGHQMNTKGNKPETQQNLKQRKGIRRGEGTLPKCPERERVQVHPQIPTT